ncbi:helix-turn-helix domain-containing protein [Planococcus sp. FY231025]|uniref:helix-turn-helix domain-containing protein n=1 Tax=Planococcus sp. FY231025 TaxID=3455699 RepID=UPI003F8EBA77
MNPMPEKTFSPSQMEALIRVAEAVNSTLNLDELFQLTLKESIQAIPNADGGVLFLYNEQIGKLVCLSFVNFNSAVKDIYLDPHESFTGKCFSTREPVLITSASGLQVGTESMSHQNKELLNASMSQHSGSNAYRAMCVPLVTENDDCIGVITLNGFAEEGTFTEKDLRLLQAIAGQAAIALAKAHLHQDLKKKNEQFEQIIQYQQQLLLKMSEGVGLLQMLEQLAKQIQKPLSLLTIYGEDLQLGKLIEQNHRHEFPIQSGRFLLGKLLVATEAGEQLSDTDLYFIQQSVLYFTLEINRESAFREMEHRFRSELMDDLMNGMLTENFIKRAKDLGLDTRHQLLPVAAEAIMEANDNALAELMAKRELAHLFQVEVNRRFPGSLIVSKEQYFIFLLSVRDKKPKQYLLEKIKRMAEELQAAITHQQLDAFFKLGVGQCVSKIDDLPGSIEDSMKVLHFMRSSNVKDQVIDNQSLGFERLLVPNKEKDIEAFIYSTLGPVIEHDRQKNSELLKTLVAYTQSISFPGQAAKELHIHLNTLHYRLKRAAELLEVDLHNPDDLLNIQLACKLLRNSSL